jgi:hypothetical protein
MKILIEPGKSKNVIVTNAVGGNFYESWEKWAYPSWKKYCERHDLGLIVFDTRLAPEFSNIRKKPYWDKLLIGDSLRQNKCDINNVCFLDTDILINYMAPNVFDTYNPETIALVSQKENLPYPLSSVLRRIAFLRHTYYDNKYPLDSWLFASVKQVFEYHKLNVQPDFACTGFFIFNIENHSSIMRSWYEKYDQDSIIIDGGTEEVHLNYEIQNWGKVTWLDYRFHSLWIYEMAWKYPFLYRDDFNNGQIIKECIEASLFNNYFLHFAGAWEGEMWKLDGILEGDEQKRLFEDFNKYEKMPVTGKPKGVIKPKK